jgi:hypothetical protein
VIRRIIVYWRSGIDGKKLPEALFCFNQEIDKTIRFGPQVSNPKRRRKRGYMEKDSASSSLHGDFFLIPFSLT